MGGEKAANFRAVCGPRGSPPHGRGKGACPGTFFTVNGITPAWAGKSWATGSTLKAGPDHPRMGGEKPSGHPPVEYSLGSPPHGRGKVDDPEGGDLVHRITPAWAGKSSNFMRSCSAIWDHPRMGGEKTKKIP